MPRLRRLLNRARPSGDPSDGPPRGAAREEGLAGVITTMPVREEVAVKALLDAPDELALAAVVCLGKPVKQPTKLTRAEVAEFATVDSVTGRPLTA